MEMLQMECEQGSLDLIRATRAGGAALVGDRDLLPMDETERIGGRSPAEEGYPCRHRRW